MAIEAVLCCRLTSRIQFACTVPFITLLLILSTAYITWGVAGRKRRLSAARRNAWAVGMLNKDSVSLTPLIQVFRERPLALQPLNLVLYARLFSLQLEIQNPSLQSQNKKVKCNIKIKQINKQQQQQQQQKKKKKEKKRKRKKERDDRQSSGKSGRDKTPMNKR